MKIQKYLMHDCSTMTSFLNWTMGVSSAWSTLGFLQQNDTGQIQFPAISARILQASNNGAGVTTYTYDKLSGGSFAVNQQVVISDCRTMGFDTRFGLTQFVQQTAETPSITQVIRQVAASFTITSVTAATTTLTCNGTITGGGGVILTSITGNGTIWTGTCNTAHGFSVGQSIVISGTTHFNGTFFVLATSVAGDNTKFTITNTTQSGVTDSPGPFTIVGWANYAFTLSGFDNAGNNGIFQCNTSTATTIAFNVPVPVTETPSGSPTAVSSTSFTTFVGAFTATGASRYRCYTVTGCTASSGLNNLSGDASLSVISSSASAMTVIFSGVNEGGTFNPITATGTGTVKQGQYVGTITGGANNAYVGYKFVMNGFTNARNNGEFLCTSSSATQLSVTQIDGTIEPSGVSSYPATTIFAAAGWWATITGVTPATSTTGTFTIANSQTGTEVESQGNITPTLATLVITTGAGQTGAFVGPTCTISHVSSSTTTATYTYTGLVGTIRNGQRWTVVGTTTNAGGFNQTGNIVNLNTGAGTFQIVGNNNGSTSGAESGVGTARSIGVQPGGMSNTFAFAPYEIWKSNDGLTAFYVKLQYATGTVATPTPMMAAQIGTGVDGAGNLTGNISAREVLAYNADTVTSGLSCPFECNFWGAGSSPNGSVFAAMMWRDAPNTSSTLAFGIERSKSSVGADTNLFITFFLARGTSSVFEHSMLLSGTAATFSISSTTASSQYNVSSFGAPPAGTYNNYIFTISGCANSQNNGTFVCTSNTTTQITLTTDFVTIAETPGAATATIVCGPRDIDWGVMQRTTNLPASWQAGNNVVLSPIFPNIGYMANPLVSFVTGTTTDIQEGQLLKVNIGGTTRTYLFSIKGGLADAGGPSSPAGTAVGICQD